MSAKKNRVSAGKSAGDAAPDAVAMTGADVLDYIDMHGLRRMDACWMLGIKPTSFGEVVKANEHNPLRSQSAAILLRLLNEWPEYNPMPTFPKPREIFERVRELDNQVSERVFSMALGLSPGWGSLYLDRSSYSSAVVDRLLLMLQKRLDAAQSKGEARMAIRQWLHAALEERNARGDTRMDFIDA